MSPNFIVGHVKHVSGLLNYNLVSSAESPKHYAYYYYRWRWVKSRIK